MLLFCPSTNERLATTQVLRVQWSISSTMQGGTRKQISKFPLSMQWKMDVYYLNNKQWNDGNIHWAIPNNDLIHPTDIFPTKNDGIPKQLTEMSGIVKGCWQKLPAWNFKQFRQKSLEFQHFWTKKTNKRGQGLKSLQF